MARVYDGLDAEASNLSLDAVRATYVHAVMHDESHGQMQHHLARSLLLSIRLPWYRVSVADVRASKIDLRKVQLQRKVAVAAARPLQLGNAKANAAKLEALVHYAGMLDYMVCVHEE